MLVYMSAHEFKYSSTQSAGIACVSKQRFTDTKIRHKVAICRLIKTMTYFYLTLYIISGGYHRDAYYL